MKKIIIFTLVFLVLSLGLGGFFAYRRWVVPAYAGADQSLISTEETLATPDMLFLASFDIEYLRSLDVKLNGTPRLPDLVSPADNNEPASVFQQLRRSLVKQYDVLQYVTIAAYLSKESGPSLILVSGGKLRQEDALAFLKNYPAAKQAPGLPNAWIVQSEDPDTCALSKEWTIVIDNNRIIASNTPDTGVLERLREGSGAARDLTRWREFRKVRFAAAALFLPDSLSNQGIDPLTHAIASTAQKQLIDFDALYLGASAIPFPPKGDFAFWLSAGSSAVAEQKAAEWKAELSASRKNWQETLPTLAALHDRAHISARENLVLADVTFDKELAGQLRNIAGEFISLLFKGFNAKQITDAHIGETVQEMIDKNPVRFQETVSPEDIKQYDPKATFAGEADVTSGPFGISLSAVRMTKTAPRTIELEIAAKGTGLPNLADGREDFVDLIITSVEDREGRELLRAERCGPDRNGQPGKGRKMHGFSVVDVRKTVRLDETASLHDVARIAGTLRARLPSRVESVFLKGPKPGDHFDRENTRVEVMRVEKNGISYRISGEIARLLLVRGKNAKGEVLTGAGHSSMQVPGGASSASQKFRGEATEVEFVVARAVEELKFPFTLENAFPRMTEQNTRKEPISFSRYKRNEFKRDLAKPVVMNSESKPISTTNAGQIVIALEQMHAFFGMGLNLSVYLPLLRNVEETLTAVEVEIDSLKFADGKEERPAKGNPWRTFVPISRSGNNPHLKGSARIETTVKEVNSATVKSVTGSLALHVAEFPRATSIDGTVLGKAQNSSCGPVMVSEISRNKISLEGMGNQGCVYAVRALASGQDLFVRNQRFRKTESGWAVDFGTSGLADRLEIISAPKTHTIRYPFKLKVETTALNNPQPVPE